MRTAPGVARSRVGPGAALVVGGAGGLAGLVALIAFELEILVVAAEAVDRGFDRAVPGLDDTGTAHAGDAARVLHAWRHAALEPAHRAGAHVGRIVETPGAAVAVALAHQGA